MVVLKRKNTITHFIVNPQWPRTGAFRCGRVRGTDSRTMGPTKTSTLARPTLGPQRSSSDPSRTRSDPRTVGTFRYQDRKLPLPNDYKRRSFRRRLLLPFFILKF